MAIICACCGKTDERKKLASGAVAVVPKALVWVATGMLAIAMMSLSVGCTAEPRARALTASAYNYSDEYINFVWVNGKQAGVTLDPARPGDVTGGASMCCIQLAPEWKSVEVHVQLPDDVEYTVQAQIEQPWPEYPHYAVAHVLPGRKIVVEVMPTSPAPRKDLLDARLKELGVAKEYEFPVHMMNTGPAE